MEHSSATSLTSNRTALDSLPRFAYEDSAGAQVVVPSQTLEEWKRSCGRIHATDPQAFHALAAGDGPRARGAREALAAALGDALDGVAALD